MPLMMMAGVCVASVATLHAAKQITEGSVRALSVKPAAADFSFRFGGQNKLTAMADAAAAEKLLGREVADQLVPLVDFASENLVLVSWTTSGPPEGKLQHEIRRDGQERRVVFYVQGPPGAKVRGQRARIAADFFAASKELAASFDAQERF
jgi:hypothetical protein